VLPARVGAVAVVPEADTKATSKSEAAGVNEPLA
jgi:hypothetical protein